MALTCTQGFGYLHTRGLRPNDSLGSEDQALLLTVTAEFQMPACIGQKGSEVVRGWGFPTFMATETLVQMFGRNLTEENLSM